MELARGAVRQIIVQATPFCNIDCRYCYLADRANRSQLSIATLEALLQAVVENGWASEEIEFRWHAGEPLAAGIDFYRRAIPLCNEALSRRVKVAHSIQTNAILLSKDWVHLVQEFDVRVGISIDGPASIHDRYRLTRAGRGTHEIVERGINLLREAGIPFDVIAVVTKSTLENEAAFLGYFANLVGLRSLGFNVEESEGSHRSEALGDPTFLNDFRAFLSRLMIWSEETGIRVREFKSLGELILKADAETIKNTQNVPFAILGLSVYGDLYTFSPELMGLRHPGYGSFAIGKVCTATNSLRISVERLNALQAEIALGVVKCKQECKYYRMCGGGAPVNKLYENGSFVTSVTRQCELTVMAVADLVLEQMEKPHAVQSVRSHEAG